MKCVFSFSVQHFSFYEELSEIRSKMFIGLQVKYPLFLSDFVEIRIFEKKFTYQI